MSQSCKLNSDVLINQTECLCHGDTQPGNCHLFSPWLAPEPQQTVIALGPTFILSRAPAEWKMYVPWESMQKYNGRYSMGLNPMLGVGSRVPGLNPPPSLEELYFCLPKGPGTQREILLHLRDDELRQILASKPGQVQLPWQYDGVCGWGSCPMAADHRGKKGKRRKERKG